MPNPSRDPFEMTIRHDMALFGDNGITSTLSQLNLRLERIEKLLNFLEWLAIMFRWSWLLATFLFLLLAPETTTGTLLRAVKGARQIGGLD